MRKLILIFFLLPVTLLKAQVLVADPNVQMSIEKQSVTILQNFVEAQKQTAFLSQTISFYKRTEEALAKINGFLADLEMIQNIVQNEINTVKYYSYYIEQSKGFKLLQPSELRNMNNTLLNALNDSKQLLDLSEKLIKNDYFKMSDAERMEQLEKIDSKLEDNLTIMEITYQDYAAEEESRKISNYFSGGKTYKTNPTNSYYNSTNRK